eukprot:s3407_g2.t1
MDTVFTETVLNEGENEYDCERYDMLAHCHLPKPDRDRAQIRLGNSQNSQLEHLSARLVYIDLPRVNMLPERFTYLGELWLVMFRTEVFSLEEYKDYLIRNPDQNLLTTNFGVERVSVEHFDAQIRELKTINEPIFQKNVKAKLEQSAKAKQRNLEEAKRTAEGPAASQPPTSKRGTVGQSARSKAKTERLQKRIKEAQRGEVGHVSGMRELFVCNSVLIQEALLLEDEVKASFWFNASGIATVLWLVLMLWTFVLVFGWTFVPGMTAFDQAAANRPNFCGAWASARNLSEPGMKGGRSEIQHPDIG